ncbi:MULTISPECIES: hypothetical protein [Gracilibacillus]|uniref:hypothetical protein n=1 Tax=Gracilibacillus TaxID=74385 RepID=UPI0008242727|nr:MULTISPECIES: hypothetical protein [Gracilibacillus]
MNHEIKHMVTNQEPKIKNINPEETNLYKIGLQLFSTFAREDFLDISQLPKDTHSTDGVFYSTVLARENLVP